MSQKEKIQQRQDGRRAETEQDAQCIADIDYLLAENDRLEAELKDARLNTLRLHIVSEHANAAGLSLDLADALEYHANEHQGPCTIRNHCPDSLHWSPDKVAEVLAESVETELERYQWQDISTAPKDTDVLALADDGYLKIGTARFHTFTFREGGWWQWDQEYETRPIHPSRWMPLPPTEETK